MASLLEDFYAEAEEYKKKKKNKITPRQILDGDDILIESELKQQGRDYAGDMGKAYKSGFYTEDPYPQEYRGLQVGRSERARNAADKVLDTADTLRAVQQADTNFVFDEDEVEIIEPASVVYDRATKDLRDAHRSDSWDSWGPSIDRRKKEAASVPETRPMSISQEEPDYSGMSYETDEVIEELSSSPSRKSTGTKKPAKRKVIQTPSSLTDDPEAIFRISREQGTQWQDVVADEYISKFPWADPYIVKKAVHDAANKHFDRYMRRNKGDSSGYKSSLIREMRGRGRGSGGGSKKSKEPNIKSLSRSLLKDDQELDAYVSIMREAEKNARGIAESELSKLKEKLTPGDTSGATDEAIGLIEGKRKLFMDSWVNTHLQSYDVRDPATGKKIKQKQKPKYGRNDLEKLIVQRMKAQMKRRYDAGDQAVISFVDRFKVGDKAGSPAFDQAVKDIYLGMGFSGVTKTGRKYAGKVRRSRKEK